MTLTPFEFVVVTLAVYRAARALTTDEVSDPLRSWYETRLANRPRLLTLVTCPVCVGFWVAVAVYCVIMTALGTWGGTSWVWHFSTPWAIAGGQVLVALFDAHLSEQ